MCIFLQLENIQIALDANNRTYIPKAVINILLSVDSNRFLKNRLKIVKTIPPANPRKNNEGIK